MIIRKATAADRDTVVEMAVEFLADSVYSTIIRIDPPHLASLVEMVIGEGHGTTHVVFLAETEAFVKAGTGAEIVRNGTKQGHEYQLLSSLRGEHKRLECLHVTLSEKSQTYPLFQHPGTEFIFMLEGVMDYSNSRSVYRLHPGDSLQMDGEGAHGPVDLVELPIRFLSVIAFPDSQV